MSESENKETTTAPSQQNVTELATKTSVDEFAKAVNEGKEESYRKAFDILKERTKAPRVLHQHITAIRECTHLEYKVIEQVCNEGLFNYDEFHDIVKLLKEPGEEDQRKKIGKKLQEAGEEKEIVLYGEEGVGKTWMAREVAGLAVRERHFDVAIWLYLDRIYQERSLRESIAYQLRVLTDFEESEAEEAKKKKVDEAKKKDKAREEEEEEEEDEEKIKNDPDRLRRMGDKIKGALKGKKLLFIMDGQGSKMEAKIKKKSSDPKEKEKSSSDQKEKESSDQKEKEKSSSDPKEKESSDRETNFVLELVGTGTVELSLELELGCLEFYKSLIITREKVDEAGDDRIMVKPFTWKESKSLASREINVDKSEVEELVDYFMLRSKRLPAQLLLISRIVSYFSKDERGFEKLRKNRELLKKGDGAKMLDVLIKEYKRLPKSVLIDRYSTETPEGHFLHRGSEVNYNELICYWIMEGLLGHFDRVEDAYAEGHRVLMELINCGLMQKQEANNVVATTSPATTFNLDIHDYKEFFRGVRPGLAVTFDMKLGKVALADGMIKTVEKLSHDEQEIISALLLDGNRIAEAQPLPAKTLAKYKNRVKVLAISDPTSQHLELPILEMRNLHLLALRGCQFLASLEPFFKKESDKKKLEGLAVVEISGSSSLKFIPDQLFSLTPNLKTLNMSYLVNINKLPSSFYDLTEIEFLILRGCHSLTELGSLKRFKDLKVLDVSEATNLEKFEDKSLNSNTKLQVLNLSKTKLKTLPLINQLKELKYVWLSDCAVLPRIRKIDRMGNLQILDISGAAEVERFCDPSLEDLKSLVIIDISRTAIKRLPANIGDPKYLYAKDCHKLKVVPPVEGLSKLQVVHLSGCHRLTEVRKEFFANVKGLTKLDLSKTGVKDLPFLDSLLSLRTLLLSECVRLEKLEKLSCLTELKFLDLSGCEKLKELEDGSFDKMIQLKRLYLSGTGLGGQEKPLPSLSNLKNLKKLLVRDCPNLTNLPGVEVLKLEVLDCSGTVLESPPSFSDEAKPQRVDGAGIESINTSQLIKRLGASQQSTVDQGAKWDFKYKEVSECKWNISNWPIAAAQDEDKPEAAQDEDKPGTLVYGVHFLRLLKEYPSFLTQNLSTFRFLVHPSDAKFPSKDFWGSYIDELNLRDIYFEQICKEKMERCLEIREFNELPTSLRPLIARAEFIVLIDDPFLKSLIDLGVDESMAMKACWIESCNELKHVVAAAAKIDDVEKSGEAAKGKGEQRKNVAAGKAGEMGKGEGDQHKNIAAEKSVQRKGDQQKVNAAAEEKSGESAKSEGEQPTNAAADAKEKSGESAKKEGEQPKNAAAAEEKTGESAKSGGEQPKDAAAAEEKTEESAKSEGEQPKNAAAAEEKTGESAKSEGEQPKNAAAAEEKTGKSAKSGGEQPKDAAAAEEKTEESVKSEGEQPKDAAAAEEKTGESAKSEGEQPKNAAAAEEKTGESAKSEGEQPKNAAAAEEKSGEEQPKNAAEEKMVEPAKSEGDQPKNTAAEEKSGESAKKEGEQPKNAAAEEKTGEPAKSEGDQLKNAAAASGDQQKNVEKSSEEQAKTQDDQPKNPAEDLNKLETLWISDVLKLKSICEGDIQSVSFKFLKSLYLEYCPQLSVICSSSLQLQNLETLYIKYCQKLEALFTDDNPSKMEKLGVLQLWGLDSLKKIGCNAPSLRKLRVGQCRLLEHVIASRLTKAAAEGDQDTDTITAQQHENEGHEKLEILHIKSCDKLKSIFESLDDGDFESLKELELLGLPKLQKVARTAPALSVLTVGDCPSLETIITPDNAHLPDNCKIWACPKIIKKNA